MRFWAGIFCLGAALQALVGLQAWPDVFTGSLNDPDSYMRLERIFQGVQAGHLVNIVARDNSGAGVLVEWSRLLDALIWVLALPLAPLLGWKAALFVAGVALGPIGAGALSAALAFAAEPFAASRFLWLVPVAVAVVPGLETFLEPGVVHYHILLLALIAATVGGVARAWEGSTGYGFLAGLCGGFAIWLTPETMPFVLMAYAALLGRWCEVPIGKALAACAAGFFDVLGFGLAVDPPYGGYAVAEIDRLSIVYAVLGLFVLLGAVVLWRLEPWRNAVRRRAAGVGLMAALIVAWIALFPKVALGPYGILDPADMKRFFGAMQELQPVHKPGEVLQYLLPGALAVLYAVTKLWTNRSRRAAWIWGYIALCGSVALLLGQRFVLFVEFPAGFAAGLLPVALSDVSAALAAAPLRAMAARLAVIFAVLAVPHAPAAAPVRARPAAGKPFPSCSLRHIDRLLTPDAGKIVLADVAATPELLYRTGVLTVGSLYQHGVPAYLRARAAWRSTSNSGVPGEVAATGAEFLLFCPQAARYTLVADLPATTLWDALQNNRPPAWAALQQTDPQTGWRLYRINR